MHEFVHILTSWEHWAFEAISDLALALPAYLLGRFGLRRHDRTRHKGHTS